MAENEQTIPPQPTTATPPPKKGRFWRYVRRILAVILLLLLILYGSLQTDYVRGIIISKLTTLIAEQTNANVSIGSMGGDIFSGISLADVRLRLKNDTTTIAFLKNVSIRYSLWQFVFHNQVVVHTVDLDKPTIYFVKTLGDSLWNFEKLTKPSAPSAPSKPFSMLVNLEALSLSGGSFSAYDANDTTKERLLPRQIGTKNHYIRFGNLHLENLSLKLSGKYQDAERQSVNLKYMSFDEVNAPLRVHQLSLKASRDHLDVQVKDLELITDLTNIKLDVGMNPLVVLDGKPFDSMRTTPTHLKLIASNVSQQELAQFFPDLDFLGGLPLLEIEADGEFGKLNIKRGKLGFAQNSSISFNGELRNLHQPSKIYLDVSLQAKNISDHTLHQYLPGLNLQDFRNYGTVNIPELKFKGPPDNFTTSFIIQTTNGNIKGNGAIDFTKQEPIYSANLTTESINLAPILSDSSLRSNLNLQIIAKGKSFDLKKMNTEYEINGVTNSHIYALDISKMHLKGTMIAGVVAADQSKVVFSDGSNIDLAYASIDVIKNTHPYEANVTATDAPIGKFLPQFPKGSSVNANATVTGELSSLSSIEGSVHSVISGLTYKGETIAPISFGMTLQRADSANGRADIVTSDIADLSLKGIYNVEVLGTAIGDRFVGLIHALDRNKPDSIVSQFDTSMYVRSAFDCPDSLSCKYSIKLKDLRPIDHFLPGMGLLVKGTLSGTIEGCPAKMIDISMIGSLKHIYVGSTDSSTSIPTIVAKDLNLDIALTHLTTQGGDVLKSVRGHINIITDSVVRISGLSMAKPKILTEFSSDKARYDFSASIENKTPVRFKGEGSVIGATKTFAIDSFRITFAKGYEWFNEGSSSITISNDGLLRLDTLTIMKPDASIDPGNLHAQRFKLGLELHGDSIRYAYLHSTQIRVSELPKILSAFADVSGIRNMNGNLPKLDVDLSGTLSHPEIKSDFSLHGISYNSVTIDTGRVSLAYHNGAFRGTAMLHVDSDAYVIESQRNGREKIVPVRANKLQINIDSIPFLLNLADYPNRKADSIRIAKEPMSVRLETHDFPLDLFSNVMPVITELHGLGDVKIVIKGGGADSLSLSGDAAISKGSFMLPTTNIRYNFEGPIKFINSALTFENVLITNQPADDPASSAHVTGGFYFNGLTVDHFSLTIDANRLLVLSDASRETMKEVYGPLVIQTGPRPLVFHGTFDEPHLDGDLTIPQASLTLPQTNAEAAAIENDGIIYVISTPSNSELDSLGIHQDTTKIVIKDAEEEAFIAATTALLPTAPTKGDSVKIGPLQSPRFTRPTTELSFMDKMLYNLGITIPGDFWLNINFNRGYGLSFEKLRAELRSNGVVNFFRDKQGGKYETYGTLRLTEQSSYSLIKEFTPTGTVEFQRALDNPTLDITADYVGTHLGTDVKIRLIIRGTKNDPRISFEIYKKNSQGEFVQDIRAQEDIKNDALFFLATGSFPNDPQAGNALKNVGNGYSSQFLNTIIGNVLASSTLKSTIRSVGLEFGENASTKLKLAVGYKDIIIQSGSTFGGTLGGNLDYSVDVPLSTLFSFKEAKNLILRGEGHTNINNNTSTSLSQQPFLGSFLWRIPLK